MPSASRRRNKRYLFVIAGESNSGGCAPNTVLTPDQLLPQPHLQIWNNGSSKFEPLTIGTNNLTCHTTLQDNASHGLERGLAQEVLHSFQVEEAYVLKAGHGGSPAHQWISGQPSEYWQTLQTRYLAAIDSLKFRGFEPVPIVIWMSGINDVVAKTNPCDFKLRTEQIFTQIRGLMGGMTPIFFPKIMETDSTYSAINAVIKAIASNDDRVFTVDTAGLPQMDIYHYTANGYVSIARAIVDSISKHLMDFPQNFTSSRLLRHPIANLHRETTVLIPSGVRTVIPMDSRTVDTDTMFDKAQGAIVIPVDCGGIYAITGAVTIGPAMQIRVQILVNDVMVAQSPLAAYAANLNYSEEVNRRVRLRVGDVVKLSCLQVSQGNLPATTWVYPEFRSILQMNRIGV